MSRGIAFAVVAVIGVAPVLLGSAAQSKASRPYSSKPLSAPIRDAVENAAEFVKFNNWLNGNFESVPAQNRQRMKEHLYSIIDSDVKQLYAREGVLHPGDRDSILPICFAWATRMGGFGAHSVLEGLDPKAAATVKSTASIPRSFKLKVRGDMLELSSTWGDWTAVFPYYFMVGDLQQLRTASDLRTQAATVSTGFARHTSDGGHSQATILLLYSPEGSPKSFKNFWLKSLNLTTADASGKKVHGLESFYRFDGSANMHTEAVFPSVDKGAMAILYTGLAGTYEHNRPHFIDFVKALRLPQSD